jgi:exopolyphosphatase / guanosine-5'-triphosphate,3'-diphosphate pyrophosphatase
MTVRAAVDCGTNMTRLLIVDDAGRQLVRHQEYTRLGEGVDRTGRLDPEAMKRTMEVLADYRKQIDQHGATAVRAVATSAARDAANVHELQLLAGGALGHKLEVIDGTDEAALSFAGATASLDSSEPWLVVDIGGGSTELAVGRPGEDPVTTSLDVGSVRLTERFLTSDPPTAEQLSQAVSVVRRHLQEAGMLHPQILEARRMLGVAGTFTTMAAIEIGLQTHDPEQIEHFQLTRAAAEDVFRTLATEKLSDRIHNPGLPPERADIIVAGCLIAVSVMREFDLDGCLVSERSLLDGLVAGLA